jgi:hypothetical protein
VKQFLTGLLFAYPQKAGPLKFSGDEAARACVRAFLTMWDNLLLFPAKAGQLSDEERCDAESDWLQLVQHQPVTRQN